jgi:integrase
MGKRRGNNEGTICKRPDGTWRAAATVGFDWASGEAIRKDFYGKTRAEVADKLAKALAEVRNGGFIEPAKTALGAWLDRWLAEYKKGEVRPGTYENYGILVKAHIKPVLGNIPLAKLQANTLQAFYNDKLTSGRVDGQDGLSTRMVRYLHVIIRQALQQAVKEGLLSRNVADAASPPTIKNKQMRPLSEAELITFLEAAKGDRLFAAYLLAATTGLRRGELLGLCWDCVDLERGIIAVRRQLLTLKAGLVLDDAVRTKAGRRSVALTDDAIRELKAHRQRQLQERLLLGAAYQNSGLVFCREDGEALDPREFTKRFQRWLEKSGLPRTRLHDLRHTHATLLLARGIPAKLVQERLGHSSITMTLDLYSHVTPEMAKLAAESMNGLLGKSRRQGEQ